MKEIPILFSTPMVQAILEGRKTQTRRVVKFPNDFTGEVFNNAPYGLKYSSSLYGGTIQRLAYALPGDLLWVREGFNYFGSLDPGYLSYKATYPKCLPARLESVPDIKEVTWKPSIHMPKSAARIWLEVTEVRVERLQDISEGDAKAEGSKAMSLDDLGNTWANHKRGFQALWQSINGEESWQTNPWVWVISFKVLSTSGKPKI